MAQASGGYSNYPSFVQYVIDCWIADTDSANNRSLVSVNAYVYVSGSSASSSGGSGNVYVAGNLVASGSIGYFSLGRYGTVGVTSGSIWISHDSNGYLGSVGFNGSSSMSGLGSASASGTLGGFNDYVRAPYTAATPSFISRDRGSISMSTSASVPSGAPGISSYTWQQSTDNTNWNTISGQSSATLSWTGASATTQYYFRSYATNSEGSGPVSAASSLVSAAPSQPSAPLLSRTGLGVTATLSTPSANGSTLSTFTLQYAKDSGFTSDLQTVSNISSSSVPVSSLTPGTTYYFRYKVGSNRGDSDYSPSSNIAIPAVPSAPAITTALTKQVRKVTVDWDAPSLSGGATISSYEVEAKYSSDGGATWDTSFTQLGTTNSSTTIFTTADLNIAKTYQFRVRAVTDVGNTDYSDVSTLTEFNSIFISAYGYKYDGTNFNTAIQYAARYTGNPEDSIVVNGTTYYSWKVIENVKKFDGTDLIPLSQ